MHLPLVVLGIIFVMNEACMMCNNCNGLVIRHRATCWRHRRRFGLAAPFPPGLNPFNYVRGAQGDEEDAAAEEARARRELLERELDDMSEHSLPSYHEYSGDDDDDDGDDGGGGDDAAGGFRANIPVGGLMADAGPADPTECQTAPGLQHEPFRMGLQDWLRGVIFTVLLASTLLSLVWRMAYGAASCRDDFDAQVISR